MPFFPPLKKQEKIKPFEQIPLFIEVEDTPYLLPKPIINEEYIPTIIELY